MNIRQNLYKVTNVPLSSKNRRDIQKENRFNRRQENFQQRRNISVSPEVLQSNIPQINGAPATIQSAIQYDSVLSRQREYLARLRCLKKQKREANKENINKTRPFIPAGSGTSNNVLCQTEKHKPIKSGTIKGRQSIYILKKVTANISSSSSNQLKTTVATNNKSTSKNVVPLEGPGTSTMKSLKRLSEHNNKTKITIKQSVKNQEDNKKSKKNQLKKNRDVLPLKSLPKTQTQVNVESKSAIKQYKGNFKRITAKEDVNKGAKIKLSTNMKAKKEITKQNGGSNLSRIPKTQLEGIANEIIESSKNAKPNSYGILVKSNRLKHPNRNANCSNNIKSTCSNNIQSNQNNAQLEGIGQKFKFMRYSFVFTQENEKESELSRKSDKENALNISTLRNNGAEAVIDNKSPTKKNLINDYNQECVDTDSNPRPNNLDGIHLYRHELQKETENLQNLCETWEQYKQDNRDFLEKMNGDDMIHATLGQTRLLINKKFKQFSQLIDRCEKQIYNSIEGSGSSVPIEDDGSENSKPITLRDLEGFWWSMIKLQLDNIEKRFENLNRWKANGWIDPDELTEIERPTVKNVKKLDKVNKVKNSKKARATSSAAAFIAIMRKNQAEKLQDQQEQYNVDDWDVILSPTKSNKRNSLSSSTVTSPLSSSSKQQQNSWDRHPVKKINFIRYSLAEEVVKSENNYVENGKLDELWKKSDKENDLNRSILQDKKEEVAMDNKLTPTKNGTIYPLTYLSPFVSVARGKVSRKTEEYKRQCITDSNPMTNLDGIRFYRQQLQQETEDLQNLCETWEQYKQVNRDLLEKMNGDDMIHATLGQTRLLINKKFKQFSQLIDRCEKQIYNSIEGSGSSVPIEDDGSENSKPITLRDLEGFWWSMIKLQLDNIEKRFENLNRWKANDWKDPDELTETERPIVKNVKKLGKTNKVKNKKKAKATSSAAAFIAMMRKNQAEKLQQHQEQSIVNDCDVILTPIKSNARKDSSLQLTLLSPLKQRQEQQRRQQTRHTVIVRDRKYLSPSATRISLPGSKPSQRLSSSLLKPVLLQQESPSNLCSAIQEFNKSFENLNSAVNNSSFKRRTSSNINELMRTPLAEPTSARKSILKTPGTARSKLKNVLFDDKLRVKQYKFIVTDDANSTSSSSTYEEDLENFIQEDNIQRVYTLRNRKVPLRPLSDNT